LAYGLLNINKFFRGKIMSTLTDYAQISGRVYRRTDENRMHVPDGFTEVQWLRDDTITGFSAGVYKKGNVLIPGTN